MTIPFPLIASMLVLVGCQNDSASPPVPEKGAPETTQAAAVKDAAGSDEKTNSSDEVKAKESPYRTQAEALVVAIDDGKDAETILKLANELTQTGLSMLPGLVETYPDCKEYMDAIAAVGETLKDMPLEEIESGYHADGKLPKMPSADCYHGKDLVVHPATVSALAKAGLSSPESRQDAKKEIVEVLGHLTAVEPGTNP